MGHLLKDLRDKDWKSLGLLVAEGRLVAERVLAAGLEVVEALCVPATQEYWRERLTDPGVLTVLSEPDMGQLAGFPFHRGVLLAARRPTLPETLPPPENKDQILVLWQVTDPDNLGALVRSARALGLTRILLGPGCADPYSRKVLRSSMGLTLGASLREISLVELKTLEAQGLRLAAAALVPGARSLRSFRLERPWGLVLGNEGYGLPPEVLEICQEKIVIPMAEGVDSLNVGAAGAVVLWELTGP